MTVPGLEPRAPGAPSDRFFSDLRGDEPIRAEIFGAEHLEAHARQIAAEAAGAPVVLGEPLLRRFKDNSRALIQAHRRISDAYRRRETFGPDAEWLLDNFHIVLDALSEIRTDLPRGYYELLPKLSTGPFAGFPRVYAIALELIAHTDSSLDEDNITRFVTAYQSVTPLTIGEVWAVPIMLRLSLIENLHRLAGQILSWRAERHEARSWVTNLLSALQREAVHTLRPFPPAHRRAPAHWSDTFIVHLFDFLREHEPTHTLVEWLENILAERGETVTEVLRREQRRQAANQVSIGNCVTSLRLLSALDWNTFFESTSLVEGLLRDEPAGVYGRQDFATRDQYRRVVESLARASGLAEIEVARQALALAGAAADQNEERPNGASPRPSGGPPRPVDPRHHVGYYLIDRGRTRLEAEIRYRPNLPQRFLRFVLAHPHVTYFGSIALVTVLVLAGLAACTNGLSGGVSGAALLAVLMIVAVLPASELAVGLVNFLVTSFLPPRVLPKLAFKEGVPADCATFVVMPTMLIRPQSAAVLLQRLETHYLSSSDPHLYFALLTDFADGPSEHMPEDDGYVRAALEGVKALNERYCGAGRDRFFLCHRRRLWNPVEGCWMGWERKRGKLLEFNRLLRGDTGTTFAVVSSDLSQLPVIRYVITLDADTQLPHEAAQRLIATLAHPLNQPWFDPRTQRVVAGYGVLQPRVSLSLPGATRSLFSRLYAGSVGLDPYTTAVSNVYQDLFGSGTYTGKGIYEIDAFAAAVGRTFPDNHILSHDLIEGNYARCGLVTDIELFDEFPGNYLAYARREHRWARGDWQIAPWLFRRVPGPDGRLYNNPLPAVDRWKIFDNLRRSLLPPALVSLLMLAWLFVPGPVLLWTGLVLLVLAWPLALQFVTTTIRLLRGLRRFHQMRARVVDLWTTAGQTLLGTMFLLEQAGLMVDAIGRTLFRLYVTRRHLLEWESSATTEQRFRGRLADFCRLMWPASAVATSLTLTLVLFRPSVFPVALPMLVAWLISPSVAFWVSRPSRPKIPPLTPEDRRLLRRAARKSWSFFETFVGEEDHWLPPDNYQEDPKDMVAHRTSPTNIGFYLASCVAAHDFGYLTLPGLLERLERSFATLDHLERCHGHFLNWYDTRTMRPLQPLYISTVDSGNLLSCLVVVKRALLEHFREPLPPASLPAGLTDTLELVSESLQSLELSGSPNGSPPLHDAFDPTGGLERTVEALRLKLKGAPSDLLAWDAWLKDLQRSASELNEQVGGLAKAIGETPEELQRWAKSFADQVIDRQHELTGLAPWLGLLGSMPPGFAFDARAVQNGTDGEQSSSLVERWQQLLRELTESVSIDHIRSQKQAFLDELSDLGKLCRTEEETKWLANLEEAVAGSSADELRARILRLVDRASGFASSMDFRTLYNERRNLFSVGYNLSHGKLDNSHYDLLASEASLTSFLAIARGEVPKRHWFQLGRPLTRAAGSVVLLSWGGTLFEYLMPRLFLPTFPETLLDESQRTAAARQIEYGRQARVPWGVSESAFSALDSNLDYQYQAFGVPGLGLKRGLGRDLVIAPYATFLATLIVPQMAVKNLNRLAAEGAEGAYGFYEAIDYTAERLLPKRHAVIVKCFMAHHIGMSLVALANCLLGNPMPRRFRAEPIARATELLLQERVPYETPLVQPHTDELAQLSPSLEPIHLLSRRLTTPHTTHPRTHLLSNGQYTAMVTNAGAGRSTWRGLDVTRWREDRTCDAWGQFLYVRDLRSEQVWSAGHQPIGRDADEYEVVYSTDKAEFRRVDGGIETHMEVVVSPEKHAEVRRLMLTNHNARTRELEVTSYAEVVLHPHGRDLAHPAFGKLFLETEYVATDEALLCRRRPRGKQERPVWGVHVVAVDGPPLGDVQYETDRARFLGRGRTPASPVALERGATLSGTIGPVLDPIFSLRRRVRVGPDASVSIAFTTAVADTRAEALALADQFHDWHGVNRAFELAWAHSQVELRHLRLTAEEAHLFQRLAGHILYTGSALRPARSVLAACHQGQRALWRFGISGDNPIVLATVAGLEELPLVRQLLAAHAYWRLKGLEVDLVILNEHEDGYFEELHEQVLALVRGSPDRSLLEKPGGVFVPKATHLSKEDQCLLQAAARCVLAGSRGSLSRQIEHLELPTASAERDKGERRRERQDEGHYPDISRASSELLFFNGLGGFRADGREYIILLPGQAGGKRKQPAPAPATHPALPPAPWINVVSNRSLGFLVSESGAGFTWSGNSQRNRLTPWNNDPVSDPPGEVVYLRDEETGDLWTPTPAPIRDEAPYVVRHGQGYTVFEHQSHELSQRLLLVVPPDDPIKLISLRVRNLNRRHRRLSITFYAEWVLGTVRDQASLNVATDVDSLSGALLARNSFNPEFGACVAFADVSVRPRSFTADRTEFLGRNGSVVVPMGLDRTGLRGAVGATLDPCAAIQVSVELAPQKEKEVVFYLGEVAGVEEVRTLLLRYREPGTADRVLQQTKDHWERLLGAMQVRTPNPALDLLVNRWLLYQVVSCRLWGRSAFYQSGGAYGFRDQLQDVMALVYADPQETRAHILRSGARQFREGDIQHWWHPESGAGIRTRFSDDYLWLPFVVCHYVATTADTAILDELVPFLQAPPLRPDQEEDYRAPEVSDEIATLYEHCVRAVEHGLRFGEHGLPLMAAGDWNDGMNQVGPEGRGESVWNGWFLLAILPAWANLAEKRDDSERATRYRAQAERLQHAIEEYAWDGGWYRRAYFDDGTPLGSAQNDECRIDSLPQSWAVLSGSADPARARQSIAAAEEYLVRPLDRLILLFTPPFDKSKLEPGYIKGYVPGIRENGGQYTHAAAWLIQATASLGNGTRALELFDLINPILHASTPAEVQTYRIEPYVVAGDVYSEPPHTGRGGWSWYTGAAGWLYRVVLETILGFRLRGDRLTLNPCIPRAWPDFEVTFRYRSSTCRIKVSNPAMREQGVQSVLLDGNAVEGGVINLADDGREHEVRVTLG